MERRKIDFHKKETKNTKNTMQVLKLLLFFFFVIFVIEDELTDKEWNEIESDMKEIEEEEINRQEAAIAGLKQWKGGK